jgi:beta-lactam-binding protein with PASTA domain
MANAQSFADALHVVLRVRERRADAVIAPDVIVSQTPASGSPARRGDTIDVVVSMGPPTAAAPPDASSTDAASPPAVVQVPRLIGMGAARAQLTLDPLGLRIGHRREDFDENRATNVILRQSPAPDASVPRGSAVDIVLNSGTPPGGEEH